VKYQHSKAKALSLFILLLYLASSSILLINNVIAAEEPANDDVFSYMESIWDRYENLYGIDGAEPYVFIETSNKFKKSILDIVRIYMEQRESMSGITSSISNEERRQVILDRLRNLGFIEKEGKWYFNGDKVNVIKWPTYNTSKKSIIPRKDYCLNPPLGLQWGMSFNATSNVIRKRGDDIIIDDSFIGRLHPDILAFKRAYNFIIFDSDFCSFNYYFWNDSLYEVKVDRFENYSPGSDFADAEFEKKVQAVNRIIQNKYYIGKQISKIIQDTTYCDSLVANELSIVRFAKTSYVGFDSTKIIIMTVYYKYKYTGGLLMPFIALDGYLFYQSPDYERIMKKIETDEKNVIHRKYDDNKRNLDY
jgi:hypothetical protein